MSTLAQVWEEKLNDENLGIDELDKPFQEPLTGHASPADRIPAWDRKIEASRKRKLDLAQERIQEQYEAHGFDDVFLNDWLWKYLAFLEVRRNPETTFASIASAHRYVTRIPSEDQALVTDIWMDMKKAIVKFVDRTDQTGKLIPIHNWINKVFAAKRHQAVVERKRYSDSYSQIENDLSRRTEGQMSLDYAMSVVDPDYVVDEFEKEARMDRPGQLREMALEFIRLWPFHGVVIGERKVRMIEVIVTQIIIKLVPEMNATAITRHMQQGTYPQLPSWIPDRLRSPAPYPMTNVRTIERITKRLKEDLTLFFRKHMIRTPQSNPRGFNIRPPRTLSQEMSINGSFYQGGKATDPDNHLITKARAVDYRRGIA